MIHTYAAIARLLLSVHLSSLLILFLFFDSLSLFPLQKNMAAIRIPGVFSNLGWSPSSTASLPRPTIDSAYHDTSTASSSAFNSPPAFSHRFSDQRSSAALERYSRQIVRCSSTEHDFGSGALAVLRAAQRLLLGNREEVDTTYIDASSFCILSRRLRLIELCNKAF